MQKNIKYFIAGRVILKQLVLIMTKRFLIWTGRYFAKDISADGETRMTGLTESIAVIAIDKHGNESKG